jgi:predicted RNA-binding protein with PUA-like domain
MNYFLVKADPETDYSIMDLKRDGETTWTGVHSFAAIGHIKNMRPGDRVYFYHSQKQKAIVGMAEVSSVPYEDKDDPRTSWAVKLKYIKTYAKPVSLAELKSVPGLSDFALIRIGRLSVMPVSDKHQQLIEKALS